MARPRTWDETLRLRIPTQVRVRLDRVLAASKLPGIGLSRSDAARHALLRGLDVIEADLSGAAK